MLQVTSERQTSGLKSMIYKIVPGAVGTKPVWNIAVNVNVFFHMIILHLGDNHLRKTMTLGVLGYHF